ncbi:CDC50/LEM3 family [Sporodiniella umbellata]|nr:CDC50/LEM3 family [Sporodiniella umbellata]
MPLKRKSRKPDNGPFQQQRLPAWQPVLTPKTVLPTLVTVGILFLVIGGLLFWSSTRVHEILIDYTRCGDYNRPIYLDSTLYQSKFSKRASDSPPSFYYENATGFLDASWGNPNNLTIKRCIIDFTIPEAMQGPVIMYYRLTGFYQNRKQYINNYDTSQLGGQAVDLSSLRSNCDPQAANAQQQVYYPCGLVANSMFNDTASDLSSVTAVETLYRFDRKDIAWPSDKQKYKPTHYPMGSIAPPANWATRYPNGTYTQEYPPPDISNMERLMVWMHVAALPDFRKIWGRNNHESLQADRWRVQIDLNFETTVYGGTKWLVISTTSALGGKNSYLGIAYITLGAIILFLGILFTFRQCIRPRKLWDGSLEDTHTLKTH